MTIAAVVTAAGYGTRLGATEPKALVHVADRTLLAWALSHVAPLVDTVVVTAPPTHLAQVRSECESALAAFPDLGVSVIAGGQSRQESVAAAITALAASEQPAPEIVMIHDAARAFMPTAAMAAAITAVQDGADGAIPVVPVVDTIVSAPGTDGTLGELVDRERLRAVQTPQVFTLASLRDAHARAGDLNAATDDASLVVAAGYRVVAVDGHSWGFKVTRAEDLDWATHIATQLTQKVTP